VILTLTVNPAIDHNVTADRLVFEDRAHLLSETDAAGGRGINASRVLHSFGAPTVAVFPSGGETGRRFEGYLAESGFPFEAVPIRNPIRTNLTITDQSGLTVKLNSPGPELSPEELGAIEAAVRRRLCDASWLLLCGSLPPGVPAGFYRKLIEAAGECGVRTLLDADGDVLQDALPGRPTVVAPNQQEAERLLNKALITRAHCQRAAERIQAMGAGSVLLTLGSRGAVCAHDGRIVEVVPPRVDAVCPIGSGDAMNAAFAWAFQESGDAVDAARWGVAAGTASSRLPGLAFATLAGTREIYDQVEVRPVR
jgi:1-phosphofructokinase family hexose kinase